MNTRKLLNGLLMLALLLPVLLIGSMSTSARAAMESEPLNANVTTDDLPWRPYNDSDGLTQAQRAPLSDSAGQSSAGSHTWETDADFAGGALTDTQAITNSVRLTQTVGGDYVPTGEYLSAVYDASDLVDWAALTYTATVPTSTTLTLYTRVGNVAAPDVHWSEWYTHTAPTQALPQGVARYIQYRVDFTSVLTTATPILDAVSVAWDGFSYTEASGLLNSDTIWTAANAPYLVTGNVLVNEGVNLTVEPGVTVWFSDTRALQVQGGLTALGTAVQPITFTSWHVQGQPGDWGAIAFSDTAVDATFDDAGNYLGGSALQHATVEYAGGGSFDYAVDAPHTAVYVDHCTIQHNGTGGLRVGGNGNYITDNYVHDNTNTGMANDGASAVITGNTASNNGGTGISNSGNSVTLDANVVNNNGGDGMSNSGTSAIISDNTANSNGSAGISNSSAATIDSNIAENNGGYGIANNGAATISENSISGNNGGINNDSSSAVIESNAILNNTGNGLDNSGASVIARRNVISGNVGGITWSEDGDIAYNTIISNTADGDTGGIYVSAGYPTIHYNTIQHNGGYALYNNNAFESTHLDARHNYWGTTSDATIQSFIFDWNDDSAKSIVDYEPYLTSVPTELAISKTVTPTLAPLGGVVTYTIALSNTGDAVATNVVMTDPLPSGVTFGEWLEYTYPGSALFPDVRWGPYDLAAGESVLFRFTAIVTDDIAYAGTTITNTAYFSSDNGGGGFNSAAFDIFAVSRLYHTNFAKDYDGYTTTLHLQNPTDAETTASLSFYEADGTLTLTISRTIPAKGTLVLSSNDIGELPDNWTGGLIVEAIQPLQSIVELHNPGETGDTLGTYKGIVLTDSCPPGVACIYYNYFGPFFGNSYRSVSHHHLLSSQSLPVMNSSLVLMNAGSDPAYAVIDLYRLDGTWETSVSVTDAIPVGGRYILDQSGLSDGFVGSAIVSSDQPIVGLISQSSADGAVFNMSGPLRSRDYKAFPRAMKNWDEVGGQRTTNIFIGNVGDAPGDINLTYIAGDGATYTLDDNIPAYGGRLIDLSDEASLPDNNIYASILSSDQPVVMGELTYYDTESTYSTGAYNVLEGCDLSLGGGESAYHLCLPHVTRVTQNGQAHTLFSVQNMGPDQATISITYYDENGAVILSQNDALEASGWTRYDQSQLTSLGDNFEGSAIIAADQPIAAWVDKYMRVDAPSCTAPLAGVSLLGPSEGLVETPYAFTAIITPTDATPPVAYTWSPPPDAGQGTRNVTYTWAITGAQAITVAASHCSGAHTVADHHMIAIEPLPPVAIGDSYENDDTCADAQPIPVDGAAQAHTFHTHGDEDWIVFTATTEISYVIESQLTGNSPADVVLELYDSCDGGAQGSQDPAFSPNVRFTFAPPADDVYYVRLRNATPSVYGEQVGYQLSIRALAPNTGANALLIVAGKLQEDDPLQPNIYNVTNAVYKLARENGCSADQIAYLAPDVNLDADGDGTSDVTDVANRTNLKNAITSWAAGRVGSEQSLTLYFMDHGGYDKFYLNGGSEFITPTLLSDWISQLEASAPGAEVNIIMDACQSGSFIDPAEKVSGPGRMVIASTAPNALAYASQSGAEFSDALLNALAQGSGLKTAFDEGQWAVSQAHPDQTPWLDSNGDGIPNEPEDVEQAAQRAFACGGAPDAEQWPPHIAQVEVKKVDVDFGTGEIWAKVQDDQAVQQVWAVVYEPSYEPPEVANELAPPPLLKLRLDPQGEGWYGGLYPVFKETGAYRVVIYAEDNEGLLGRPQAVLVPAGGVEVSKDEPTTIRIPVGDYETTIEIPAGAVSETTELLYRPITSVRSAPASLKFAGRGFELHAYRAGDILSTLNFIKPVAVTVNYSEEDVKVVEEDTLALYYREGDSWSTEGILSMPPDTTNHRLEAVIRHLSEFALFGQPSQRHMIYLPLVLRE